MAGSAQSKRKRSKLLDMLLNTNWSKQSQQATNLTKLNRILFVCDANFLDEKSGESPLSLVITSQQINASNRQQSNQQQINQHQQTSSYLKMGPTSPPSSLFSLQCQSMDLSQSALLKASISDLCQSHAPLVQRIILLLIKYGALIDFRNSDGRTPLHVATMKSNFWALKTLLDLGASTDCRDINGLTPLYYSILHKADLKVTQLLLNHNNNTGGFQHHLPLPIGITDQHGWQESHQACKLGLDAHLEKLLYYGCDINARISGSGNTPLHVAAINDQLDCAKVLLMRGADKTITNNSHQTAHQVAVISNNLDMAEFIAEHDETKVLPFRDRPANYVDHASQSQTSTRSTACSSASNINQLGESTGGQSASSQPVHSLPSTTQRAIVQPQPNMNPLSIDLAQISGRSSVSTGGSQPQSLLSIGNQSGHLNLHTSNVSPCLSQRSCATSNTTSSSGVCCDLEGNHSVEDLRNQQSKLNNSQSQHSNVTIISITNKNDTKNCLADIPQKDTNIERNHESYHDTDDYGEDEDDDLRSSASSGSNWGLQSLMSDERPLYVGTFVEAMSEYRSGDPSHLQLRRGDLIEVLEYKQGPLPKLANKPMIFGVRSTDGLSGLFPSFCVQRSKHQRRNRQQASAEGSNDRQNIRGQNIPESRSMAALDCNSTFTEKDDLKRKFKEVRTILSKTNGGFGFVLRGAKINPSILAPNKTNEIINPNKLVIDERLMAANNLISLQYLDEIEPNSPAFLAGLKRGDFLVAVNEQDVRLSGHEQVVQMIRQSGSQVQLTIATPIDLTSFKQQQPQLTYNTSKTISRAKPEPPKRDPTTTLTRNRTQRVELPIQVVVGQQQPSGYNPDNFDQSKPLPSAPSTEPPASPAESHNSMVNRSMSTNLLYHQSAQSLSSAADTQSISSVSTISTDNYQQLQKDSQQPTPTHSSSSTATLTTVATSKPKAPPKPNGIGGQEPSVANQPTYQSAAIITTTKRMVPQSSLKSPPQPEPVPVNNVVPAPSMSSVSPTQLQTPLPPPPPPPLPDFEIHNPIGNRMSQRRKSAPINQLSGLVIDKAQLLRKRESLATIGQVSSTRSTSVNHPPIPAQFGAVAAACAAAANNRLQRQQQIAQSQGDENHNQNNPTSIGPTEDQQVNTRSESQEIKEETAVESSPNFKVTRDQFRSDVIHDEMIQPKANRHHTMSATLGRRLSAMIIQQPRQQATHSQSQTLRSKPKRPSIPSYDELPPPPPPLSPMPDEHISAVRRQHEREQERPVVPVYHVHHQTQHLVEHQLLTRPEKVSTSPPKRHLQDTSQQQQQAVQMQQRLIKQQLIQQQVAIQQQQQLKLQQKMQSQQRLSLGYDHNHQQYGTILNKHHVHDLAQLKQQQQQVVASNHSHHSHHHHQHSHHSHHQNHYRNHDLMTNATVQPQYHVQAAVVNCNQQPNSGQSATSAMGHSHHHHGTYGGSYDHTHHHRHHQLHQQQQIQQHHLYQQLRQHQHQHQMYEQYMPMVYSTDSYARQDS